MILSTLMQRMGHWPLPALLAWVGAWGVFRAVLALQWTLAFAVGSATALGVLMSFWGHTWWRRVLIALGFPLSLALTLPTLGLGVFPPWVWLIPLVLLLLVYPMNAWRDAPLFPTPDGALIELTHRAPLAPGARVLDAGCGLGHGLQALRAAYPAAQLHGLEWSWPLRFACALRCPWAFVRRGDMWRTDWSGYDLVYLFQRPESMPHVVEKATAELRAGAWLVSLEFEANELTPAAHYLAPGGKMVWLYQAPFVRNTGV